MRLHVFAAAILLAACSGSKNEQKPDTNMPPASAPAPTASAAGISCPAQVPGTTVRTEDTPDGVAMIFTTSDDAQVPTLRQSVSQLATSMGQGSMSPGQDVRTSNPNSYGGSSEMEPRDGSESETMHGDTQGGMQGEMHGEMNENMQGGMPAARTNVVSIDKGARLELTPTDPSTLEELREHAQRNAQMMQDGSCPMMKHGAG